jgi:hypothetical protein
MGTALRQLLAAGALLLMLHAPPASAQDTLETDVKAAFLYNFTRFVEWPGAPAGDRFTICVVGDAALASSLDAIITGEEAGGRPLTRMEPTTPDDARLCQILFVGGGDQQKGSALLAAVQQSPVLTVGDPPTFLQQGGVIRFVRDAKNVRFDISTAAMRRAGLKVSSKLLRVARRVEGQP